MSRIRTVKPEFWTSQQIVECSTSARLLFIGLWTFADDRGVIPRRPRTIKMQVFPGDDFTAEQIDEWLCELESHRLLGRFDVDGYTYLVVTGWHHQKIERPTYKYPAPPDDLEFADTSPIPRRHIADTSPPEWKGVERSGEDVGEVSPTTPLPAHEQNGRRQRRQRKTFMPPSVDDVARYCAERGNTVDAQNFVDHYVARGWKYGAGKPMVDWKAAVRTWEKSPYREHDGNWQTRDRVAAIPSPDAVYNAETGEIVEPLRRVQP